MNLNQTTEDHENNQPFVAHLNIRTDPSVNIAPSAASLIALGLKNSDSRRMGTFTAYMSATFLVLFLIFFSLS